MAAYLTAALTGYLLGCFNPAYFLARARGFDIRDAGSHGAGASNAVITMGLKAGVLVALCDVLKTVLAVALTARLFPGAHWAPLAAGGCAVLGHIFPFYLRGRGGKGFASFLGVILALDWRFFLVLLLACLLITLVTDYIVFATMTAVVSFPVRLFFAQGRLWTPALLAGAVSLVIVVKHISNFRKIVRREEIGLRAALKKKTET